MCRLRWRAQQGAPFLGTRIERGIREPGMGVIGCACRHGLSGYPPEERYPVCRGGQHPPDTSEGGYLVRIYVELDKLAENERVSSRKITVDHLIASAQRILRPYTLDVKEVAWWSVYEIGQRPCDKFDDVPEAQVGSRQPVCSLPVMLPYAQSQSRTGDECVHAGRIQSGLEAGGVLEQRSPPELLDTYSAERQSIASELIDFDREWAKMLSMPLKSEMHPNGIEPEEFSDIS